LLEDSSEALIPEERCSCLIRQTLDTKIHSILGERCQGLGWVPLVLLNCHCWHCWRHQWLSGDGADVFLLWEKCNCLVKQNFDKMHSILKERCQGLGWVPLVLLDCHQQCHWRYQQLLGDGAEVFLLQEKCSCLI